MGTTMDWHPNYSRCRFAWVGVVSVQLGVSKSVSVVSTLNNHMPATCLCVKNRLNGSYGTDVLIHIHGE